MTIEVLDPTYGDNTTEFALAPRPTDLQGRIVGIISNGKHGTRPFFDAIENELLANYGVSEVVRVTKSNYSAPADPHIIDAAQHWHALIAGVGD